MTVLRTVDLTKKFGDFAALDKVNIEVGEGEVYGFIGPNGSGKSTTLRVLLGILKATEGRAEIFGKDSWKEAVEIHKRVAYVPGEVSLWPNLTGGEVIDLLVKLRGGNDYNRREELIQKFDLDPSKKCRTYSKGNRQKVALIAALSSDVDLYILDEPTSGLDPLMERTFQEYIIEEKKQGKSILLSSHILSEVEKLCDKVAIIREGKIIETGSLKDLRHLTGTILLVETKKPILDLANVRGVSGIQPKGNAVSFQVDSGEVAGVISYISQFEIVRIESSPPTLEQLFMRHYEVTDKTTGAGAGGEA
ncbi:ABC transporter ATP-binding protein [Planococcus donghaensis]|uniref:ABC transporter ATP-binding protein n=1 Tax=Planococcus donghaensis TaxID=414778 RepID=A0A1C7ELM6_9BACL|nr:ABC transporter ATP-binding protein [Planococcus donghaensis]ANU24556.1 ABC transporter ATP-binding protein [Planococcus donghaensis]